MEIAPSAYGLEDGLATTHWLAKERDRFTQTLSGLRAAN